jgi:2-polyprenyl-6-methoxyphenol hydroxylase-like FAD-dependent oxidoreductase
MLQGLRFAIIGAGLSGLTCARALVAVGARNVRVFDCDAHARAKTVDGAPTVVSSNGVSAMEKIGQSCILAAGHRLVRCTNTCSRNT